MNYHLCSTMNNVTFFWFFPFTSSTRNNLLCDRWPFHCWISFATGSYANKILNIWLKEIIFFTLWLDGMMVSWQVTLQRRTWTCTELKIKGVVKKLLNRTVKESQEYSLQQAYNKSILLCPYCLYHLRIYLPN